ncbi:hypothetical protein Sta7437_0832 [Stanieria cyanosphaera PCC 7437]|uniref:Uncharacterized protein n=1 Tax=Stanieria cyanosphaera (strain ATCC 29371 / PCC 7437) TaxID=111780 RepID=K9XP80_STAC7|nr:hypothetical protein [Stanieria cyanosphaera]AFZ34420.1 hypothetical protein Sta7437_0832 [Stanieria cyanosphaera PCC 7437]
MSNQNTEQPIDIFFKIATETTKTIINITNGAIAVTTSEIQKLLERTTTQTGLTLKAIAQNPLLRFIDKIFGLNWLLTFLGEVDTTKIRTKVEQLQAKHPQETNNQIAHRLIVAKSWQAGRLGILTNIIPPIAAALLGIELIATAKLQAEMVYEIAAAYGLDLEEPTRRGEVLALFGLSLGTNFFKTGLSFIEILPGIGPAVGASTNAAILYVLGQTTCRFYEGKSQAIEVPTQTLQTEVNEDWQIAIAQAKIIDQILVHMVRASYPNQNWSEILPTITKLLPSSVDNIAAELKNPASLDSLLNQLEPDFAPLLLNRCQTLAQLDGTITPAEQEIIDAIAHKFELNLAEIEQINLQ